MDSVYEPGSKFREVAEVVVQEDLVGHGNDDPSGHGTTVLEIINRCSGVERFTLYQVVPDDSERKIDEGDITHAVYLAHKRDEVDLINLSIGADHISLPWKRCSENRQVCAVCDAVQKAVQDGVSIVAGAGNASQVDSMCCPALKSEAICVGGFDPKCTAGSNTQNITSPTLISGDPKPHGAIWLERPNETDNIDPICSAVGCGLPEMFCNDNKRDVFVQDNVPPVGNKPEILAPPHYLVTFTSGPEIISGTSFATPIVSAQIAEFIRSIKDADCDVTPSEIKNAITDTGRDLDKGDGKILSAKAAFNRLGEPHDIRYVDDDDRGFAPP